jgi:hypothetical protein
MAYNPSPKVRWAEEFGKKFKKDQVIVIAVDQGAGTTEYISWGKNKALCNGARGCAELIQEELERDDPEI